MAWARRVLDANPDAPRYGSPEWCRLSGDDPRAFAAVVRAAEAWLRYCSREEFERDELARQRDIDRAVCERIRQASHDVSNARAWGESDTEAVNRRIRSATDLVRQIQREHEQEFVRRCSSRREVQRGEAA